jgi:phosphopantetheine adenylyltransferase
VVEGYIWRFAKKEGASIFFRGIRSWEKDGKEELQLAILNTWGPLVLGPVWPVPTIYLEGKPEYNHISSTLIRDICKDGGDSGAPLSDLVPPSIADRVKELYSRDEKND